MDKKHIDIRKLRKIIDEGGLESLPKQEIEGLLKRLLLKYEYFSEIEITVRKELVEEVLLYKRRYWETLKELSEVELLIVDIEQKGH